MNKQIVLNYEALSILNEVRNKLPLRNTMKASYSQGVVELYRLYQEAKIEIKEVRRKKK